MSDALRPDDELLLAALAGRTPSESLPLLLEVMRRQAGRRRPAALLAQRGRDPFVAPSMVDQRTSHQVDGVALDAAADFEALLLSPLAPLGCCAVVSPTSQDRAVSTVRGTEVISDPTNVMAIECARRLAADRGRDVRLCTLHQVVRAQRYPPASGFSQHFRMFALASAGSARPDHGFEVDAFVRHASTFWRFFDHLESVGFCFPGRAATLFVGGEGGDVRVLADRLRRQLAETLPGLAVEEAAFTSGYYAGVRLLMGATSVEGRHIPIADTGLFDWVATLTSNRRFRFVASGLGIQLVPLLFRAGQPP